MKRYLRIVWLCMLVLSMAVGVQAAPVTWDVGSMGVSATYADSNWWIMQHISLISRRILHMTIEMGERKLSSILGLPV
jgi:hypothetical protein